MPIWNQKGVYLGNRANVVLPSLATNGLISHLDAANTSSYVGTGTSWTDLSGSGNSLTLVNSPTFTSPYISFNGTNQYANFTSTSTINITNISVFMWVYPVGNGVFLSILGQQAIDTSYHHASIDILSTGVFRTGIWNGTAVSFSSSAAQSFNNWYYIGFTYSSSTSTLTGYLNSVSFGSPATFTWSRPNPLYYAVAATDSQVMTGGVAAYGNGRVSRVELYNRALSATEISGNFNTFRGRYGI